MNEDQLAGYKDHPNKHIADKEYALGMGNNPQPLSGQQMQALAKNHADALAAIKRDIELRKWAVDQAVAFNDTAAASGTNLMKVARDIHAFLVEGTEKAT